jgi:hypothetical protein
VETYRQALEKVERPQLASQLQDCMQSHKQRVTLLSDHIRTLGGEPATSSGVWGAFAKAVEANTNSSEPPRDVAYARERRSWRANGKRRTRWPVSLNTAFATAAASGGTPGSPTPVGSAWLGTMCTSTRGMSSMRSTR